MSKILDNSYAAMTATRDLFNGTSFRISEWTPDTFYSHDKHNIDFVAFQGSLLYCSKSHWSNEENKPILFVNEYGIATGLQPNQYWAFIFGGANQFNEGIPVLMPQLKIINGYWYVSYDEGSTWTEAGKATGDKGDTGESGETIITNYKFKIENGHLFYTYNDITWTDLGKVVGNDGKDGIDGSYPEDIVYVKSTDVLFGKSNSPYIEPDSWDSTIEIWTEGTYIWTRNKIEYSNNEVKYSSPVCITGNSGVSGNGIKSITEMYYLSSDYNKLSGGEWTYNNLGSIKNGYIWTKLKIEYTDGTIIYTDPICNTGLAGRDGNDGQSGAGIEYIYAASKEKTLDFSQSGISYPDNSWNYDSAKKPWFDNPQTVTPEYPVVWVSTRSKGQGNNYWGNWNPPTVHAVFGFDGPGQEYIYIRSSNLNDTRFSETGLPYPDNSWESDKIPSDSKWTDNPSGVSPEYPIEWESVRSYNNNAWGEWSTPTIHSKFGFDATTYSVSLSNDSDQLYYKNIQTSIYTYSSFENIPENVSTTLAGNKNMEFATKSVFYSKLPNGITSIGAVFKDSHNITDIILPESLEIIGGSAFAHCYNLTNICIPKNVTRIERSAFAYCYKLPSIIIPDNVTFIGHGAFNENRNLSSIYIGNNVNTIENVAFEYTFINSVDLPSSLTTIGGGAFANCKKLETVYCRAINPPSIIKEANTERWNCFLNCPNLKYIYVPFDSVEFYKSADGWKDYDNYIVGFNFGDRNIPEYNYITETSGEFSIECTWDAETVNKYLNVCGFTNIEHSNTNNNTRKVSLANQTLSTTASLFKNTEQIPITFDNDNNPYEIIYDNNGIATISKTYDEHAIIDESDISISICPEPNIYINKIFKVYLKNSITDYDLVLSQEVIPCDSEGKIKEDTNITIKVKKSPLNGSGEIETLGWDKFDSENITLEINEGSISEGIWKFSKGSIFNKPSITLYVNSSIYDTEDLSFTKDGVDGVDGLDALTTVQVTLYKASENVTLPTFTFDSYNIYNYEFYKNGQSIDTDNWSYNVPESDFNIYACSATLVGNLKNGILKIPTLPNELNRYIFNIYECNNLDDNIYFHYYTTGNADSSLDISYVIREYKTNGKTDNLLNYLKQKYQGEVSFDKIEGVECQDLCVFNCSNDIEDWERFEYLPIGNKIDNLTEYSFQDVKKYYRTYAIGLDVNNSGNILIAPATLISNYSGPEVIGWSELSNPSLYKWIKSAQIAQICLPMSIQKDSDGNLWYKNISPLNYTFNILNANAEFPYNYVVEKSYLDNIDYDYYDGLTNLSINKTSFENLHIYRDALGDNDLEYLKNAFGESNIANNMVTISNIIGTVEGNNNIVAGITNGKSISYDNVQQNDPPMIFAGATSISEVNNAKFRVNKSGEVTASNLNITGGSIIIGDCEIRPEGIKMTGDITVKTHYNISKDVTDGVSTFTVTTGLPGKAPDFALKGYGQLANSYVFSTGISTVKFERLIPSKNMEGFAKALSLNGILIKNESGGPITVSYAESYTTDALSSKTIDNNHIMFLKPISHIDDNANMFIYWNCSNQF